MKIYPYRSGHLDNLLLQPAQRYLQSWYEEGGGKMYEGTYAFSLLNDKGDTLICAGLTEMWKGRANAWAIISSEIGSRGMLMASRCIQRYLSITDFPRIEAYVDTEFEQGRRWVEMLGFVNETPQGMRQFVNGRDCYMYAKVK